MRIIDTAHAEITRAALLALITADPAAFQEALGNGYGRLFTVEEDYTLQPGDILATIHVTGGLITLPGSPARAMSAWLKGSHIQLASPSPMRLVSAGGTQTIIPANTTATFTPISPAIAILQCVFIGNEWHIFEH